MKGKQSKLQMKGYKVNPVILEIDETQSNYNSQIISKMAKKDFSQVQTGGGFKKTVTSKPLYRPENDSNPVTQSQLSSFMGLDKTSPPYMSGKQAHEYQSFSNINHKVDSLVRNRAEKNERFLADHYTIANEKDRFQEAYHVKSSLDVINLENIESKLEAHRRMMKPIQDSYNERKGKTTAPDRYGFFQTNINVDQEYDNLQKKKDDQIYQLGELAKKRQDMEPEKVEFDELWEQKKKNNPKLASYDAQYQQFLLEKDAKQIINHSIRDKLFTWDKYTKPEHKKSKPKIKPKVHTSNKKSKQKHKSKDDQSPSKYGPDGLMSVQDLSGIIATKDDKLIASYIFAQIDKEKIGWLSKEQLHDYILSQAHIINGYQIDTKWLFTDLDNFETKRKGIISRAELGVFLATLNKVQHPSLILSEKKEKKFEFQTRGNTSSSFGRNRHYFEKLFNSLDFNDDKILKREQFIQNVYMDADCLKLMDQQAIFIKPIQKSITYRQIIECILNDYRKQRHEKLKKSKEFITLQKFCQYFEVPQNLDLKHLEKGKTKKAKQSTEITTFDLPDEYLLLFKDIYNSLPRVYQEYVTSMDFIQTALRDPQICVLSDELCRIESIETELPLQTIFGTLHRMQKQCDEYSSWEGLKTFFSRRGRPLDWDFELIQKKKELRAKQMKNERSKIREKDFENHEMNLASQLSEKKKELINSYNKYTIPEPFDITDMKNNQQNQRILNQGKEQFDVLKKQFKAKPVNKQILEPRPDLIEGKVKKKEKSEQKRPVYKYENYENDRIERVLKKAQQKYEEEARIKQIKDKTEIKATNIGIDLTKKYQDILKQQKKKKQKEISKNKTTVPKVSDNLYPKDINEEKAKKLDKIKNKMEKEEQVARRKKEQQERNKNETKEKNQQAKKIAEQARKQQEEAQKKRGDMQTDGYDFKPKIKKKQLSEKQKETIQMGKRERQRKKKEEEEKMLIIQEQKKKKVMAHEKKVKTLNVNQYSNEEIVQHIDEVNFEDLLLDAESKALYRKQFDDKNKTKRQLKEREHGLAGRERAAMQQEEKRIFEEKKKYKEKRQQQMTEGKKDGFSVMSQKGQRSHKNQLEFHRSHALKRYRAIMQGKEPLSEFDKYSVKGDQI